MPLGYGYFNVTTPKNNREKIDIKLEERCATLPAGMIVRIQCMPVKSYRCLQWVMSHHQSQGMGWVTQLMVRRPTEKFIQLNPVKHLYYFLSNYRICACYTSCKYLYFYIIFLIQLLFLYLLLFRGLLRRPWSSVNILFAICTSHTIHLVCRYVSPQMSRLLAVRLFS